ncbi:MAG TPA: hypothetical protein VF876_13965 [Burkholderiales bacterium]
MVRAAFAALCMAAALGVAAPALAQSDPVATVRQRAERPDELFNWYYASVFGTGYYRIGEEQVGVIRVPLRYELRPASAEHWGIRLTLPVSLALAQFDLQDFDLGKVRAQGLSVLPGIELEIPLGATTRYARPAFDASQLALGGRLAYAGYSAGGEASQLVQISLGGELTVPAGFSIAERAALFAFQLIGTAYLKEL